MDFRDVQTYKLAKEFHNTVVEIALPSHLARQMRDALSSIVLNVAEGIGKKQVRAYYLLANGSLNEVMACLDLVNGEVEPESRERIEALFKTLTTQLSGGKLTTKPL